MSQKKMEAYKEAKKNKRQIEKKQKRGKILGWTFGILVSAAVIAGCVYLVYYTNVLLPNKQAQENAASQTADDIVDFLNSGGADDTEDGADVSEEGSSDVEADDAGASDEDSSDMDTDDAGASDEGSSDVEADDAGASDEGSSADTDETNASDDNAESETEGTGNAE